MAYEAAHGVSIPKRGQPGHFQVDHECHNDDLTCPGGRCLHRRCVEETHLVGRTPMENTGASTRSTASVNRAKTHCARAGHPLSGDNLGHSSRGTRYCRACHAERGVAAHRARRAAKRAARA